MRNYKRVRGGRDSTLTHITGDIPNEAYDMVSASTTPIQTMGADNAPLPKILAASTASEAPELQMFSLKSEMGHLSRGELVDDKESP
jgi:hypothetical protein